MKKVRKRRGSRTHGYGVVGQHRKAGTKGKKKSSFDKGGWTYVIKYEPDYFGKKGFKSPRSIGLEMKIINLDVLEDLSEKLERQGKLEMKNGKVYLNLKALGYDKLLGKGRISKPYLINVPLFSETAARKVEEKGGKILIKEE